MRLDRYVFGETLRPTLLGVGLYTFVLVMNQFFVIARQAIQKDLSGLVVAELIALELPRILLLTIPMGVLLGVLVGLGRLSADNEITAMRASGVSYYRIGRPVLAVGLLFMGLGLLLYHVAGPRAHMLSSSLTSDVLAKTDLNMEVRPRVFFDSIPGTIVYCRDVDPSDATWPLRGVLIRTEDDAGLERILVGKRGRIDRDPASGRLTFQVDEGELHFLDPARPAAYTVSRFHEPFSQSFQPPGTTPVASDEDEFRKGIPDMTGRELDRLLARHEEKAQGKSDPMEEYGYRKALVEKSQRNAVPFAALAFALLGLPLGIISRRGGRSSGFAISLLVIILFWVGFSIGRDMALEGKAGIFIGVWGANIVLLSAALLLILIRQRFENFSPVDSVAALTSALLARLPGTRGGIARGLPAGLRQRLRAKPAREIPGIPILDRHVASQFVRVLLLVLLSACTIVWVVTSRNFLDLASESASLDTGLLLRYLAWSTPGAAWYVLPVAAMIAAMTSLGLLERNNELTAMKAAGVSLYRVSAPILAVTVLLCGGYLLLQEYVAPAANTATLRIEDELEGRAGSVAPGTRWIFGDKQLLYGYRDFDAAAGTFSSVSLLDFSDDFSALRRRTWAGAARWDGTRWLAGSGWKRTWKEGGQFLADDRFTPITPGTEEVLDLPDSPAFFARREQSFLRGSRLPEEMSMRQLGDYLESSRRSGFATKTLEVAWYAKSAFPVTPLVMVLLGLPFAFRTARRGALYGVGIAMGLILVYWAVFAVFNALGVEGLVHPIAAAWVPNLLFGIAGAWMFLSVRS